MKLSNLEKSNDRDVEKWLEEQLDLTHYQREKMRIDEIVRFSPFYFYKEREKVEVSIWWRLTIFIVPFYLILLYLFLPFKMVFTGKWGYGRKFIDSFHSIWMDKLKLNL